MSMPSIVTAAHIANYVKNVPEAACLFLFVGKLDVFV